MDNTNKPPSPLDILKRRIAGLESDYTKILLYGYAGSGKTALALQLAKSIPVVYIDAENSGEVIFNKTLFPDEKIYDNITWIRIRDEPLYPRMFTELGTLLAAKAPVLIHSTYGVVVPADTVISEEDNPSEWYLFDPTVLPVNTVWVIDSGTQLSASCMQYAKIADATQEAIKAGKRNPKVEDLVIDEIGTSRSDYGGQGSALRSILTIIQNSAKNIVLICHAGIVSPSSANPEINKVLDDQAQLVPLIGSSNVSTTVGKYFGNIVRCYTENGKYKVASIQGTALGNRMLKSRRGVNVATRTFAENPLELLFHNNKGVVE